jgi:hypothetical protein
MRGFKPILALAVLIATTATGADLWAGTLSWPDAFPSGRSWQRPNLDLQSLSPLPRVAFSSLSFFVDQSGTYAITSDQTSFGDGGFDGVIFLYAGRFDPADPLRNLIAANDDGPAGNRSSRLSLPLAAGTVYHLVTSLKTTGGPPERFLNAVTGPGAVRPIACFLGDELIRNDVGDEMALLDGRFCVDVTWRDFAGRTGIGQPVEFRTDDSGMFWFFQEGNWELQVKMIQGCALNGHYWVFLAGTTNVQFTVRVRDLLGDSEPFERVYTNALGHAANAVTDTAAFACGSGG